MLFASHSVQFEAESHSKQLDKFVLQSTHVAF